MCLIQKERESKRKEEEEGPTLHQSPPGGGRRAPHPGYKPSPGMWIHRLGFSSPWPSPKKGLFKCQSFLQRISKIKMQSHVVWGPWVTPNTLLSLSPSPGHLFSAYGGAAGEPAVNQKG